jgi:hypothetical protein
MRRMVVMEAVGENVEEKAAAELGLARGNGPEDAAQVRLSEPVKGAFGPLKRAAVSKRPRQFGTGSLLAAANRAATSANRDVYFAQNGCR